MKLNSFFKKILFFTMIFYSLFQVKIILSDKNYQKKNTNKIETYYLLFDQKQLHEIRIYLDEKEWLGLKNDMLEYKKIDKEMRTGNYKKAEFVYSGILGKQIIKNIGFRTKGNFSREIPYDDENNLIRTGFKIKFNLFIEDQNFCSLNEIDLRYSHILTEAFAYNLFDCADVMGSKTGFCKLIIYVNNKKYNYGIYEIIEPVDKCFLKKRFGSADGNLYKCLKQKKNRATLTTDSINKSDSIGIKDWKNNYRPVFNLKSNKNKNNYSDIIEFINKINTLDNESFEKYISNVFDVDAFLKYLAINTLIGNFDDYWSNGNNYYLYFIENKVFFIPCDFDSLFMIYIPPEKKDVFTWKTKKGDNFSTPLVDRLLNIPKYFEKYKEYLIYYINEHEHSFTVNSFYNFFKNFNNLQKHDRMKYFKSNFHNDDWDDYFRSVKYIKKMTISLVNDLNLNKTGYNFSINNISYYAHYIIAESKFIIKEFVKKYFQIFKKNSFQSLKISKND